MPQRAHRRITLLLVNVTDESGAPRHEREAAHDLDRHSRVCQHGRDGAGRVDLRGVERRAKTLECSDVSAGYPMLACHGEQARGAWIVGDMHVVTEAGEASS